MKQGIRYEDLQVLEPKDAPFSKIQRLEAINSPLLFWYEEHARILPWRSEPTPYRVWISEIMLQQTRVEAVKPYFARFMEALPDIPALAEVEEDRLMKLWEGLGYYNRARNLQKAAREAVEQHGGELPGSYEELLKLPGIGPYTAGAIASIAFQIPVPAVDGNVLRVISRVCASREDITKQSVKTEMEKDLLRTMPKDRARDYNQTLMEIGATVCIPNGQPKCAECPLQSLCLAHRQDITNEIPVKAPKKGRRIEERTILLLEYQGKLAVNKRPAKGLLAGLYEYPNLEGKLSAEEVEALIENENGKIRNIELLKSGKHIFSHVEWHMTGYRVILDKTPENAVFVEKQKILNEYSIPSALRVYTEYVENDCKK